MTKPAEQRYFMAREQMREERGSSRYREDYDEEYRPRRSYEEDDEDQGDGRQRRRGYSEKVG